jgi:hypothetical protein
VLLVSASGSYVLADSEPFPPRERRSCLGARREPVALAALIVKRRVTLPIVALLARSAAWTMRALCTIFPRAI